MTLSTRMTEGAYRALGRATRYTAWTHFERLQANQWRSREELETLRWEKLRRLLHHAMAEVPFYQQLWTAAGVDPRRFRRFEDVRELPVTTRQALLKGQEEDAFLLSRRSDYELTHSSGTTGPRVYLPFTRDDMQVKYAGYLREFYATDWRLGVRSAAMHYSGHPEFGGRHTGEADRDNYVGIRNLVFRLAHRRVLLPPYAPSESGDDRVVAEWYRILRRYRPFLLETMDFNIVALADYIERYDLPQLRVPRMIVLASLSDGLRRRLEEAFSTEIFNRFGPHEMEGVAYACHAHRGLHMAIDSVHTEFLDIHGQPVGPGELGRIVLTDLDSRLMPLIRYEIGDIGSYLDEPCRCGRGFPLMTDIAGRTRDLFRTAEGHPLVPAPLVAALQDEPGIRLFQLIQERDGSIEVRVVPHATRWSGDRSSHIVSRLDAVAPGQHVRVVCVESVQLERNGKFCYARRMA